MDHIFFLQVVLLTMFVQDVLKNFGLCILGGMGCARIEKVRKVRMSKNSHRIDRQPEL